MRNQAFDSIKGLLVLLVVVGHVLLGSLADNVWRYLIYLFHMPLFLGLTGYFVKPKLLQQSAKAILIKYYQRLLRPFFLAMIVYYGLTNYQKLLHAILTNIFSLYPYYHLWYVPAILLFVVYTKVINTWLNRRYYTIFWLIFAIAGGCTWFFESVSQWGLSSHWLYQAVGDKRFYYFFSYFLLGFLWANRQNFAIYVQIVRLERYFYPLTVGLLLFSGLGLYVATVKNFIFTSGFFKIIFNDILIIVCLRWAENIATLPICYQQNRLRRILARIGQVSLPIYLWHVLPILLLKQRFANQIINYYWVSGIVLSVLIGLFIVLEDKSLWLNRWLYGKNTTPTIVNH